MLIKLQNFLLLAAAAVAIFSASTFALGQEDGYTPAFDVGSGESDWWTVYPDQHENATLAVKHPDWVLDELKDRPLLILVHSSNCVPCLVQIPRIESAVDRFGDSISYHDVLAEGAGFKEAVEILNVYDPRGGKQYVPTNIFITLAEGPEGKAEVAWHSKTDIMSQEDIDSYMEDAIYYHKKNLDSWD
ncbi:MAG: hypothetical protein CG440_1745 [Methanosaeta sp. NSM2]|nr:thioredoxin family protein [Methanothrix sp.]OYV12053.1 MAG: hypothetical protein CG440_1745 [Methanosaeta sp. NSM2]